MIINDDMSVIRDRKKNKNCRMTSKYFYWFYSFMNEKLRIPDHTYVAIPLKNIRNRRLVWKVKIAIKHRVLSHPGSKIIRFLILIQRQVAAAGWKTGDMKFTFRKVVADFYRSTHSGGVTLRINALWEDVACKVILHIGTNFRRDCVIFRRIMRDDRAR